MTTTASVWTAQFHVPSSFRLCSLFDELGFRTESGRDFVCTNWRRRLKHAKFVVTAVSSDGDRRLQDDAFVIENAWTDHAKKLNQITLHKLQEAISARPLFSFSSGKFSGRDFTIGFCLLATMLIVVVRSYAARKSRYSQPGSVADLVRRGQLKSDRRGISTPLKYEDPFNNPMVKVSKNNLTVEMCGKVYRLAPVTLTGEQRTVHQQRRSRAYQWKRPTVFLREGESVPPDIDPDTVRWIPANHPFATTASDIDEDLAQNNVYQKNGVPFRIKAEHEALQRKLESLQNEQKLGKLVIDPAAAKDFERSQKLHMKSEITTEHDTTTTKLGSGNKPPSEEIRNS